MRGSPSTTTRTRPPPKIPWHGSESADLTDVVVQADVLNGDEFGRLFERAQEEFGGLDIFVSNARPELPAFFAGPMDISPEQWDAAFNSQAKAFLFGARAAAQSMPDGGQDHRGDLRHGRAGRAACSRGSPWGPPRRRWRSAVRYVAVALAKRGITVNAVSPSWTEDSVLNTLPTEAQQLIRSWHERGWTPMGRLATPADVGNVVALLCSEMAGFVTGQVIMVDGGASLMNAEVPPEIQLG